MIYPFYRCEKLGLGSQLPEEPQVLRPESPNEGSLNASPPQGYRQALGMVWGHMTSLSLRLLAFSFVS